MQEEESFEQKLVIELNMQLRSAGFAHRLRAACIPFAPFAQCHLPMLCRCRRARAEGSLGNQMCSPGHPVLGNQGAAFSIAVADEL